MNPGIKVHFSAPRGNGPNKEGIDKHTRMDAVPRIGDNVYLDGYLYRVHVVVWYPEGDHDEDINLPFVYVVLRD